MGPQPECVNEGLCSGVQRGNYIHCRQVAIIVKHKEHEYLIPVSCETYICGLTGPFAWWRHQMETFSALLAICAGNPPVTGEFPAQRPMTLSFDVFFDMRLNENWVNKHEAGDLRRHRAHYDVTVMWMTVYRFFGAGSLPIKVLLLS